MTAREATAAASQYLKSITEGDTLKVSLNTKKIKVKKEIVELQIIQEGKVRKFCLSID